MLPVSAGTPVDAWVVMGFAWGPNGDQIAMTAWSNDELDAVGAAEEVEISSRRRDGTLRKPVTIWVVRHGDDLYVRSVKGRAGAWFRGFATRGEGHVAAGPVDRDVSVVEADADLADALDAVYREKYRRYAGAVLNSIISAEARSAALKLTPSP